MILFHAENKDIVRAVKGLQALKNMTEQVILESVNEFGEGTARELRQHIANQTGLGLEVVRRYVKTSPATTSNLSFSIDVDENFLADEMTAHELPQRDWQGRAPVVGDEQLVQWLVNGGNGDDGKVCQVCLEIAAEGPYTVQEAMAKRPHGGHIGTHSCRCILVPFQPAARVPMTVTTEFGTMEREFSVTRLGQMLAQEIEQNLVMSLMKQML